MKTKIVRIGNSRGVRIPKPLLEEAGLDEQVQLRVVEGGIMIESERAPRAGWADAAALANERGDDTLLDDLVPTRFDETDWEW
jgi:antitoxin MazE